MRNSLLIFAMGVLTIGILHAQPIEFPKNPLRGQLVFEEKGCIECHAIGGYGGTEGPDLSRDHYFGSVLEIASVIWNHTPQMNRKFRQLRMNRPLLTPGEMQDLLGFLYYLRYLDQPGSVARGKQLLESKRCISCHKVAGSGGDVGPDFEQIQQFASPVYMVQAMWNHGPDMQAQIEKHGIEYPNLTGEDIVNISAYTRQAAIGGPTIRMSPGDPSNGKVVFKEKKCNQCHLAESKGRIIAPDLSKIELKKGVTEIAGLMWNHGPMMMKFMKKEAIAWPTFKGNEMADLIAYLYFLGYTDKQGDAHKGAQIFKSKGCNDCHQPGGGIAPDMATIKRFDSTIRMMQLMWNHVGQMDDMLIVQNKPWPKLSTTEMRDLYAYLQTVTKK